MPPLSRCLFLLFITLFRVLVQTIHALLEVDLGAMPHSDFLKSRFIVIKTEITIETRHNGITLRGCSLVYKMTKSPPKAPAVLCIRKNIRKMVAAAVGVNDRFEAYQKSSPLYRPITKTNTLGRVRG